MAMFSLCPLRAEGMGELSGVSFIEALIPFIRGPPKEQLLTSCQGFNIYVIYIY
jgi:hypothetical protein